MFCRSACVSLLLLHFFALKACHSCPKVRFFFGFGNFVSNVKEAVLTSLAQVTGTSWLLLAIFTRDFVWLNKMAGACTGGRSTSQTYFKIIHQVKTLNIITAVCMSSVKLVRFLPFRFHRFLVSSRVLFRYMKQLDTQYFEFLHKTSLLLCCVSWRTCSLRLMYPLNVFHKKFSFREVIKAQKKFRFQRLVLISFSHYLGIEGNV